MDIRQAAPNDLRAAIDAERRELLELLDAISDDDWRAPTAAGRWCVRDVALHLLDDDLGWLSRGRDGDLTSLLSMDVPYRDFVRALDEKNQRWVDAAAGLSRRVVHDLLAWGGEQVAAYYDTLDLVGTSSVSWAGGEVPQWLGIGRDFTERWVHQQQIREAVGKVDRHGRHLPVVLAVFVWAFPHQLGTPSDPTTVINLRLGADEWHLSWRDERWMLDVGASSVVTAAITMGADTAWRQLTGAAVDESAIAANGPDKLVDELLAVRSIIV